MAYRFTESVLYCDVCGKLKDEEIKSENCAPPFILSQSVEIFSLAFKKVKIWCANCGDDL